MNSFWCACLLCAMHGQVSHLPDPGPFCQTLCGSRTWGPTSWSSPLLLQGRILWPAEERNKWWWVEAGTVSIHSFIHSFILSTLLGTYLYTGDQSFLELWSMTDVHITPGRCQTLCRRQDVSKLYKKVVCGQDMNSKSWDWDIIGEKNFQPAVKPERSCSIKYHLILRLKVKNTIPRDIFRVTCPPQTEVQAFWLEVHWVMYFNAVNKEKHLFFLITVGYSHQVHDL